MSTKISCNMAPVSSKPLEVQVAVGFEEAVVLELDQGVIL